MCSYALSSTYCLRQSFGRLSYTYVIVKRFFLFFNFFLLFPFTSSIPVCPAFTHRPSLQAFKIILLLYLCLLRFRHSRFHLIHIHFLHMAHSPFHALLQSLQSPILQLHHPKMPPSLLPAPVWRFRIQLHKECL